MYGHWLYTIRPFTAAYARGVLERALEVSGRNPRQREARDEHCARQKELRSAEYRTNTKKERYVSCTYIYICLSVFPSICLSIYLSVYLSS